jgi:hypothetical protein
MGIESRKRQAKWYIAESVAHNIKRIWLKKLEVNCDVINLILKATGDYCYDCTHNNYPIDCGGFCDTRDKAIALLRTTNGLERRNDALDRRKRG